MVTVGNIRAGQILAVEPIAADYYEFTFGFGTGFIDKGHLEPVQGRQKVDDGLGDLNKPLSNQSLITGKIRRFITLRMLVAPRLACWRIICVIRLSASLKTVSTKPVPDPYWRQTGLYQCSGCAGRQRYPGVNLSPYSAR